MTSNKPSAHPLTQLSPLTSQVDSLRQRVDILASSAGAEPVRHLKSDTTEGGLRYSNPQVQHRDLECGQRSASPGGKTDAKMITCGKTGGFQLYGRRLGFASAPFTGA